MISLRIIPIILSGGNGSRLWPLSRSLRPKQFLGITSDDSLFQMTVNRLNSLESAIKQQPIVVANNSHRFLVGEQCREIGVNPSAIILEPCARNTAPAIAIAAMSALNSADDPILLVLPSDHLFTDNAAFNQSVTTALNAAQQGSLVTFGIVPTRPETGYGYIKAVQQLDPLGAVAVDSFVEKPDLETAKAYLADGSYTWNSGMFMFRASVFLDELAELNPMMYKTCLEAWEDRKSDFEFIRLNEESFAKCPSDSIDYAVMEKTKKAVVVPLDAGWNDVGAWPAVWDALPQDTDGNVSRGDVILQGTTNSYIHADSRLVSLVGVDNLIVVETSDAVLVAHKDKAQDVKKIVEQLKEQNRPEVDLHREVFRPWGSYDSVDSGKRFQVKRITVNPDAKLSLQMHHHRAEHWVVVSGTASVRIGDEIKLVTENESVYIPVGVVHSLENPGKVPLHLIEVQSGSYLGEDDIVRFEDKYGRV